MNSIITNKIKNQKIYNPSIKPKLYVMNTLNSINKIKLNTNTHIIPIINNYYPTPNIGFKLKPTNFNIDLFDNNLRKYFYKKNECVIMLRGHIRDSFNNDKLYNLILNLSYKYNIRIYIHTWNKKANNISWRHYQENNDIIDDSIILNYFKDLNVVSITIDDDYLINIEGNKKGNIYSSTMPIIGWKNMWYGIQKVIDVVYNYEMDNVLILNTRFDVLTNSCKINGDRLVEWISKTINESDGKINKNIFFKKNDLSGIDNQIIGDKYTMKKLIDHFNKNLDKINDKYKHLISQEYSVYYENDNAQIYESV